MARAVEVIAWWVVLFGVWLATLSTLPVPELVVGAVCALASAVAATGARSAMDGRWRLPGSAWRWLGPLAVALVTDTAAVLLRARPGSFQTVDLRPATDEVRAAGHRALATLVLSATAGSVVVDDERPEHRLVTHSLTDSALDEAVRS